MQTLFFLVSVISKQLYYTLISFTSKRSLSHYLKRSTPWAWSGLLSMSLPETKASIDSCLVCLVLFSKDGDFRSSWWFQITIMFHSNISSLHDQNFISSLHDQSNISSLLNQYNISNLHDQYNISRLRDVLILLQRNTDAWQITAKWQHTGQRWYGAHSPFEEVFGNTFNCADDLSYLGRTGVNENKRHHGD